MKRKYYESPMTEVIEAVICSNLMEWSNQTKNDQSTPHFNYGGEASDEMGADAKRFRPIATDGDIGLWDD